MYVGIYEYVLYICTLYIYKVFLLLLLLLLLLIVGFSKCSPPKKRNWIAADLQNSPRQKQTSVASK